MAAAKLASKAMKYTNLQEEDEVNGTELSQKASAGGGGAETKSSNVEFSSGPTRVVRSGFVYDAEKEIRLGFLRKVYGILSLQLGMSVIVALVMMFTPSITAFVQENPSMVWISYILSFACLFALFAKKDSYPTNMKLLGVWTFCLSYLVGSVCTLYTANGMGDIVAQAFGLTATITITLTVYTLQSKRDFSFLGAGLCSCLWILILVGFMSWFFPMSDGMRQLYSLFGAIVFSLYIIFDTYMISKRMGPDDYIMACVELYLDIMNLFLYILQLLAASRD